MYSVHRLCVSSYLFRAKMESLIGYGSDDECETVNQPKRNSSQADANYEEVQMDLSEESNDSSKADGHHHHHQASESYRSKTYKERSHSRDREYNDEDREKYKRSPDNNRSKYDHDGEKEDKYKGRNKNEDDRYKGREDKGREFRKDKSRDDRSRYKDDKYRDSRKPRTDEQDKYRDNNKRDEYRDDRRSHRNSSRERHRSRSPKRSDYRNRRSTSRDRGRSGYGKRYDRATSKMDRLEKLGIELNTTSCSRFSNMCAQSQVSDKDQDKGRFFMPGITGRFTEQIQRRKMLWQKKDSKPEETITEPIPVPEPNVSKNWQNTTFAQDTDGKVANKFKRLMGIKAQGIGGGSETETLRSDSKPDVLKKQEEMFNSMEAQYEVARTATHTMRGVGLGFGSFQR